MDNRENTISIGEISAITYIPITPSQCSMPTSTITVTSAITVISTITVTSAITVDLACITAVPQQTAQCSLATTTVTISSSYTQPHPASSTTNQSPFESEVNSRPIAVLGALSGLSVVLLAVVITGWVWTYCIMKTMKKREGEKSPAQESTLAIAFRKVSFKHFHNRLASYGKTQMEKNRDTSQD